MKTTEITTKEASIGNYFIHAKYDPLVEKWFMNTYRYDKQLEKSVYVGSVSFISPADFHDAWFSEVNLRKPITQEAR